MEKSAKAVAVARGVSLDNYAKIYDVKPAQRFKVIDNGILRLETDKEFRDRILAKIKNPSGN